MSKRKKSNPSSKLLIVLLLLGAGVVGMLAAYVKLGADVPPNERRVVNNDGPIKEDTPQPTAKTYYFFDPNTGQKALVEVEGERDPVQAVVERYAETAYPGGSVKLLSVDVKEKVAALNFTKGFATEAGSFEEGQLIEALMKTLGQFDSIDKAQILVDGETLETGHNVYDEVDVIRG